MPMMGLCCSLRSETKQVLVQSLQIVGGATESIFPLAEVMLRGNSDYQQALEYVAARKKMERYQSVMDFLFCELFPGWRMVCRRFYTNNGPQLKLLLTPDQVIEYNGKLLKALEVAHDLFCEQRCKSWTRYREAVARVIQPAA